MAKNTVDGGNPSEPIHGFDGAVAGEVIQSVVLVKAGTDTAVDPVAVFDAGTYGYASGTTGATVNVPAGARLRRVSVLAGSGLTTVTIGGGNIIGIPPGGVFDEQIAGLAIAPAVVIGGIVASYYISWVL